ncbi:MAG: Maf family nucleotide pyrophosphatase [Roseovarius sp.]
MPPRILLASSSEIRAQLLRNAGVPFEAVAARVDETAMRDAMIAEGATPRDIADALAEMKARKVAARNPESLVIGCDQVLALGKEIFAKPETPQEAEAQLKRLRGQTHQLLSAAVLYDDGEPVWRHVGVVRMTMRDFSDAYLQDYLARNWESVRTSVGAYKLEEEGVRLFAQVQGDYFCVLGLPLLELLAYLGLRGVLDT